MIRAACTAELPACVAVLRAAYAPAADAFGLTDENCPHRGGANLPLAVLEAEARGGAMVFAYEADARIVGVLVLEPRGAEMYISDLAVLPAVQGKGIGKALLHCAKAKAAALGARTLTLCMMLEDESLRRWYAANGFAITHTIRHDGAPITTAYWACGITQSALDALDSLSLQTEHVLLQWPIGIVSAAQIAAAIGDEETLRYMDSAPSPYTLAHAEGFLAYLARARAGKRSLQLGMFARETGVFLGMCTLSDIDTQTQTCELGYWLTKSHTRKGYATQSVCVLLRYAKDMLCLHSVNAYCIASHARSIRLLEKQGFTQQALLRADVMNKGEPADRYWYRKVF